ncbi:MAG: EamA family transporter, partial [Candidatus Eremiobacteraeota bacterium]|nr:EamA family transporter [Candidatus Eremiobacteraeota bacterium]
YVLEGERLTAMGATGLLLGFAGLLYLLTPSGIEQTSLLPTLAVIFSAVTWGLGSILQRRYGGRDLVQGSAMQMLVAGVILIVLAALTGQRMTAASLTPHALVALGYLIVFGSLVGYSCYLWLMRNVSTTLASTYAYVNPVVAIAVSAWLLREHVAVHTLIAAAVIVSGVALMMLAPKPQVARMEQLRAA